MGEKGSQGEPAESRAFPSEFYGVDGIYHFRGLTKREWFAGQALIGLMAATKPQDWTTRAHADYALVAFDQADAMLAEAKKPSEST